MRWSTLSLTIFFVSTTTFVNCYDLLLPLRASLHFVKILQKNDAGCYFPSPSPKCSKLFPFETSPCLQLLPSTYYFALHIGLKVERTGLSSKIKSVQILGRDRAY